MNTVTSPTKFQTIQYPAQLKAQLPKTPLELKARMPKLQRKIFPLPRQPLPPIVTKKVLIVLQENTGRLAYIPDSIPANERAMIEAVIDVLAETFEDLKASLQGYGKYNKVVLLTDNNCTRQKLLDNLVIYSIKGWTIDLLIMGHGNNDKLELKNRNYLYGEPKYASAPPGHRPKTNIRSLKADALARGCNRINLRLVYMCNCWGSTTNDDWQAIGALHVIGPMGLNVMPEPQITFFFHNWLGGQTPQQAALNAYNGSIPFYMLIYPPTATVRFERKTIKYVCGAHWESQGCVLFGQRVGCWKPSYCTTVVEYPVGVNLQVNEKIVSSKPIWSVRKAISRQNWTFQTIFR
jgi:hypothetical protein